MELGKKIVKIRKDNNLTQEDFAEKYNVTRQTISSWENSKSYPDLDTLVKISNDFKISLDVLLKEDKKVIENISKSQKDSKKYKRTVVILGTIIGLIIVCFGVYALVYNNTKNKLEQQFNETIKTKKFSKDAEGTYSLEYTDNITYSVPNQKMPGLLDYSLHFHAKYLYCEISLEDKNNLLITWLDNNYYGAVLYDSKTKKTIVDTGLLSSKNVDQISIIKEKTNVDEKLLKKAISKGNDLYKEFYE